MKPKKFKESNITFGENQKEYMPLPAFKNKSEQGEVVTCCKLSFIERIRILLKGEVWLSMMTFNTPLTPTFLTTKKSEVLIQEK